MKQVIFYMSLIAIIISACSVRKKLPMGETLYNGCKVTVVKDSGFKVSTKSIRTQMEKITIPKKNKMILGWPYKVWAGYVIGETKKQKGLKHWLREKFAEYPVLGSTVKTKLNVDNMKGYLENEGYYRSKASGDTIVKGYKLTARYKVTVAHPYTINAVNWKIDSSKLLTKILEGLPDKSLLVTGDRITLDKIKTERSRVDLQLKNQGYYYFNPDYLVAYVDTSLKDYKANIYMSLKPGTPQKVKGTYIINNIIVFPNYTLLTPPPDTSLADLTKVDGILLRDTTHKFKPFVFTKAITYRPGSMYSLTEQNKTLNRFINLGAFKFVKNRFEPATHSDTPNSINAYYYLTPQKKKTVQAQIGSFAKSNAYVGGQLNVDWLNHNIFGGAEAFNIKNYFSYETIPADSTQGNSNYRVGTEVGLVIPRFFIPFSVKENNLFPPKTRFTLGYEWFRRQQLYTKNFYRFQYEVNWKTKINVEHTVAPVSITYTKTSAFSPRYQAQIGNDKVLRLSNLPEIVSGSFYNLTTSSTFPNGTNVFYLNANAEAAGNVLGAVTNAKTAYSKTITGAYFAQYLKADVELRYSRKLAPDVYLANRVIVGAGMPYGNSKFLPFARQFIIGGSLSLRGFVPRHIGPGTTQTTAFQQVYYPQVGGDYKLEMNSELRFPIIAPRFKGALFVDAGNVWLKDSTLFSSTGVLTKDFMHQLAADAGIGFRVDITILIIRIDIAFPIAKPWLPEGQRWVLPRVDFGGSRWRSENLVFNIGIGYPF